MSRTDLLCVPTEPCFPEFHWASGMRVSSAFLSIHFCDGREPTWDHSVPDDVQNFWLIDGESNIWSLRIVQQAHPGQLCISSFWIHTPGVLPGLYRTYPRDRLSSRRAMSPWEHWRERVDSWKHCFGGSVWLGRLVSRCRSEMYRKMFGNWII